MTAAAAIATQPDDDIYEPTDNPGMILLNRIGDVAVTWEDPNDVEVLTFIQKKIDEGYVFFIIEERFFKMMKRKKRLTDVNDIPSNRTVYLDDAEAERLEGLDKISVSKTKGAKPKASRKAKSADEVARNRTVAVRPAYAG